jgi:glycosyltransferase involved in cell wall biosynthesis
MKICYLCPDRGIPLGGTKGASAHVRDLVRAFRDLGHEVLVLAASTEGPEEVEFPVVPLPVPANARNISQGVEAPLARALGHLWMNGSLETTLIATLSRFAPDLVYERYSPFGFAGGLAATRLGFRHVLEVNAPLAWEGSRYRKQALGEVAHLLERTAFETTSLLITVSRELKALLVEGGVDASRIEVVPNGVDAGRFSGDGNNGGGNENGDFRIPGGRTVVGFVGSLKPWHGIATLAAAFRTLAGGGAYHLLVVGSGPEARIVRSLRKEFPDCVTHVEAVPHASVPRYLRVMDIAVAPYPRLERFYYSPLKVLEYMAAARPVVASAAGQITELLESGETGMLVPPGDAAALAGAIADLHRDPAKRRALGAAAAAAVRRSHLWRHRARDILSLAEGAS